MSVQDDAWKAEIGRKLSVLERLCTAMRRDLADGRSALVRNGITDMGMLTDEMRDQWDRFFGPHRV
jgi:hypothetical protein